MTDDLLPQRPKRRPFRRSGPLAALRASFLTGLIVIAPIGITVWLIWTLTGWMDSWVLPPIPPRWRPENYIGLDLRGLGVVVFLIFTALIGWIARGWMGRTIIKTGESLFSRMPVVGAVYGGIKQIAETIFSQGDGKFEQACLIETPRRGIWRIGLIAGPAKGEIATEAGRRGQGTFLAVFVPNSSQCHCGLFDVRPRARGPHPRHAGRGCGEAGDFRRAGLPGADRRQEYRRQIRRVALTDIVGVILDKAVRGGLTGIEHPRQHPRIGQDLLRALRSFISVSSMIIWTSTFFITRPFTSRPSPAQALGRS